MPKVERSVIPQRENRKSSMSSELPLQPQYPQEQLVSKPEALSRSVEVKQLREVRCQTIEGFKNK